MGGDIGLSSKVGEGTTAWFSVPFNRPGRATSSRSASFSSDASGESLNAYLRDLQQRPPFMRSPGTPRTYPLPQGECRLHIPGTLPDSKLHKLVNVLNTPLSLTAPPVSSISPEARKNIIVLVVEDNEVNQQIALRVIEKLGFSVSAVSNGVEALRYLHSCTKGKVRKPDIVLMDVHMPEMDGYQATQIIRTGDLATAGLGLEGDIDERDKQWLRGLPVVALTASAIRGDSDKCLEAGMDDYLAKPVKRQDLETMLLKWLVGHIRRRSVTEPFGDATTLMAGISNGNNISGGGCCTGGRTCGDGKRRSGANGRTNRQRPSKPKRAITTPASIPTAMDFTPYHRYDNGLPEGDSDVPSLNAGVGEEAEVVEGGECEAASDGQPTPKATLTGYPVPATPSPSSVPSPSPSSVSSQSSISPPSVSPPSPVPSPLSVPMASTRRRDEYFLTNTPPSA